MMTMKHSVCVLFSITMLGACTNLETLDHQLPRTDNAFNNSLADHYFDLASSEREQYDWYDSDYFARKGLAANNGNPPQPETIFTWEIPAHKQEELLWNHDRLSQLIHNPNIRNAFPEELAKAQTLFDCWVEQSEENWQQADIEKCRSEFLTTVATIENRISIPPQKKTQAPRKQVHTQNTVYFGFDKHNITPSEQHKITKAANDVKRLHHYRIDISGHTDTEGPESYNQTLSQKRTQQVKDALIAKDIDGRAIQSKAFGEQILAIPTADGTPNAKNRRVEINVYGQE